MNRVKRFTAKFKEFFIVCVEAVSNNSGEGDFSIINDILYFIKGKTKVKISEHFPKTEKTALDLVESAIKFEEHTEKKKNEKTA